MRKHLSRVRKHLSRIIEWLCTAAGGKFIVCFAFQILNHFLPRSMRRTCVPLSFDLTNSNDSLTIYRDALMFPRSSLILSENKANLDAVHCSRLRHASYAAPPVTVHGLDFAVIGQRSTTIIGPEHGLSLLGNGDSNYFHWMIEILPRLQQLRAALEHAPDLQLLVSSRVQSVEQFRSGLDAIVPGEVPIFYVPEGSSVKVGTLIKPKPRSLVTFNKRIGHSIAISDSFIDGASVRWLRSQFIDENELRRPGTRRIFLSRGNSSRRYNEEEIFELFKPHGFELIRMEEHSLTEQVKITSEVEAIAGPAGAAWTNIIFSPPSAKLFYWRAQEYGEVRIYESLAEVSGIESFSRFEFPTGVTSSGALYRFDHHVPARELYQAFASELHLLG